LHKILYFQIDRQRNLIIPSLSYEAISEAIVVTEEELIHGCIKEDKDSQQEIFRRYAGKMLSVCVRYTRHRMEAEDILQDSFIKVFDNLHKFKFKGSLEGWIRRIVINTALKNYDRKRFSHEQIGLEYTSEHGAEPSIYGHMQREDLLRLIASLPEGYRLVFNLYAIEGYSHKEIAGMLGIGESTSRSQLVKARKMLQAQLEKMQKIAV